MFEGIIDLYEGNRIDLHKAWDAGVRCILHRASIGLRADTAYVERKKTALARGFLWGGYHLPDGSDVDAQLNLFLRQEPGTDSQTVMALDWEETKTGSLTYDQIRSLIKKFHHTLSSEAEERYPMLYGGRLLRNTTEIAKGDTFLALCPLWYVRYRSTPVGLPVRTWPKYTLWQFDNEKRINGAPDKDIVPGADWNRFDGTYEDLVAAWPRLGRYPRTR
jgi:lysozyme